MRVTDRATIQFGCHQASRRGGSGWPPVKHRAMTRRMAFGNRDLSLLAEHDDERVDQARHITEDGEHDREHERPTQAPLEEDPDRGNDDGGDDADDVHGLLISNDDVDFAIHRLQVERRPFLLDPAFVVEPGIGPLDGGGPRLVLGSP